MSPKSDVIPGRLLRAVFGRVLADDLSQELRQRLAQGGLDFDGELADSYPRSKWFEAVELTAQSMYPTLQVGEQQKRLGLHLIEALQTRKFVKGPWLTMAKLMGPRRALKQAAQYGASHSPVSFETREVGAHEMSVVLDEVRQPEFFEGLLEGVVTALGGKKVQVTATRGDGDTSAFSIRWA